MIDGAEEGSVKMVWKECIIDGLKVDASDGGDEGSLLGWMRALQKVFYSVSRWEWEFLLVC